MAGVSLAQTPVAAPPRVGITGTTNLTLREAIEKVLANDQALVIARIDRNEASLNLTGAKGAFDPRAGFTANRTRAVNPVGSLFGGSADGKLTTETYQADPQISGYLAVTSSIFFPRAKLPIASLPS